MNFLPKKYEVPAGPSNYLRFEQGENKFRILASPVLGLVGWKKNDKGENRPVRVPHGESMPVDKVDNPEEVRHFWAMPVWNFKTESVQVLEITQKTIQRTLRALSRDEEWGSPLEYSLSVVREGEGMKTEYQVIPSPPSKLTEKIKNAYKEVKIDLTALFRNEDPFGKDITANDLDKMDKEIKQMADKVTKLGNKVICKCGLYYHPPEYSECWDCFSKKRIIKKHASNTRTIQMSAKKCDKCGKKRKTGTTQLYPKYEFICTKCIQKQLKGCE